MTTCETWRHGNTHSKQFVNQKPKWTWELTCNILGWMIMKVAQFRLGGWETNCQDYTRHSPGWCAIKLGSWLLWLQNVQFQQGKIVGPGTTLCKILRQAATNLQKCVIQSKRLVLSQNAQIWRGRWAFLLHIAQCNLGEGRGWAKVGPTRRWETESK